MEKRYYWLKLKEDFFSSKRIKKMRSIAGGDTYTIIYLKMLLKALKDDGYLYFDGLMESFAEELALDIDEKPDDVKITIQLLNTLGLMETSENTDIYKLVYMDMMTGSETAHTQRQRDYIKRKKEREVSLNDESVTPLLHLGDVEKDIEKEIDIDKEIEKEQPTVGEVLALYSSLCKSFPEVKKLTDKRRTHIRALLKTFSVEEISNAFERAERSDFLKGNNDRGWKADFDFLINKNNLTKVIEGKYDNRTKKNSFGDHPQAEYTDEYLNNIFAN